MAQIPHLSFPEIDSTNGCLKEMTRAGQVTAPFYVTAKRQTAGRGRLGRSFLSPDGGLYMSLLVKPRLPWPLVTPLAAVAVCHVIERTCGVRARIKWVNDLFWNGKKVCGILAEAVDDQIVLGIGVNMVTPPGGFPGVPVAGALDTDVPAEKLAALIAEEIAAGCENADGEEMLNEYRARMLLIGQEVAYTQAGTRKKGIVQGVDGMGGLIVMKDGAEEVLRTGEVTIGSEALRGVL